MYVKYCENKPKSEDKTYENLDYFEVRLLMIVVDVVCGEKYFKTLINYSLSNNYEMDKF